MPVLTLAYTRSPSAPTRRHERAPVPTASGGTISQPLRTTGLGQVASLNPFVSQPVGSAGGVPPSPVHHTWKTIKSLLVMI
jgi:hypothetical protein